MSSAITSERVELTVDGDDVDLHYRTGGSGPPLVFLHGIGLDAATVSWRHALPALAEERTVYAPDLPGHGESDKPDRTYTTPYYLATVEAFLDAVNVDEPAMAGLSMGGALALGHALDGGSVERLALVNSYGLGSDAYWRTAASGILQTPMLGNMLWQGVSSSKPAIRAGLRSMGATEPPQQLVEDVDSVVDRRTVRAMRRWQRSEFQRTGFRTNYADRLAELAVPTLLIHGDEDPLLPPSWSRRAASSVAESRLELVENCGHNPPRERPEWFNETMRSFCATTE
ncbi:alpha/beta hydrolase [Haloarcula sp. S1CR25-12]|uniref:Alpha/beta hydrolase n=1 Tax=Haloarcula saliterrae TaxID=2950534 RepID=A0ABU2FDL4_9EURY|nr:alpha/beta hydrolase [Haloarcula sp. S1CR25-12]MDS0260354.1 alpha/beta hydrolase [Haloarcula sp. S1CR25-12]